MADRHDGLSAGFERIAKINSSREIRIYNSPSPDQVFVKASEHNSEWLTRKRLIDAKFGSWHR